MRSSVDMEKQLVDLKPTLVSKFNVKKIGFFGSYASNTQTSKSDLDVIVEFSKPVGWGFFSLQKFLEDRLGLPIDLVTPSALRASFKDQILSEVRYL